MESMSASETHPAAFAAGRADAPVRIVVLHGYTGSPGEFHQLAESLAARLDARVVVPFLPGHGTHESSLLRVSFDDLLEAARGHVRRAAQGGHPLVIMGHSFGGYLAVLAREEAPQCRALVLTVVPYALRFPFALPLLAWLMRWRDFWRKPLSAEEEALRRQAFFYLDMPGSALSWVQAANGKMRAALRSCTVPILAIGTDGDDIATPESAPRIIADSGPARGSKVIVLDGRSHEIFLDGRQGEVIGLIGDFIAHTLARHA